MALYCHNGVKLENEFIVRQVSKLECSALSKLKYDCVCSTYKGFLPEKVLNDATPEYFTPQIERWFSSGFVDVAEHSDGMTGYAAYGFAESSPDEGIIFDFGALLTSPTQELYELVSAAVRNLENCGAKNVYAWILSDNLRLRFQMELFGFKRDNTYKTLHESGLEFRMMRYVYPLGKE